MKFFLFINKTANDYGKFLKNNWKKNLFYKLLVIFSLLLLISIFWPITLLTTCVYVYNKINKPLFKYLAMTGIIIVTLPFSVNWIQGFDKKSDNKPVIKQTSCIGPDGRKINLSNEACKKFNDAWKNKPIVEATDVPETKAYDIAVTSQIVKMVNKKCRYFFDIRNVGKTPFEGTVIINLFTDELKNPIAGDAFNTNKAIGPELGTSVYTDANTCPPSIHGDNGLTRFEYTVKVNDKEVHSGDGLITDSFESLDN